MQFEKLHTGNLLLCHPHSKILDPEKMSSIQLNSCSHQAFLFSHNSHNFHPRLGEVNTISQQAISDGILIIVPPQTCRHIYIHVVIQWNTFRLGSGKVNGFYFGRCLGLISRLSLICLLRDKLTRRESKA